VALNAIAYLYNQFLQTPLGDLANTLANLGAINIIELIVETKKIGK
jgi:hypothetical protein